MGAYDSRRFSKLFSERTEANYKFIFKVVNRDELEKQSHEAFLKKYNELLLEIDAIKNELRNEANQIDSVQKKGKNELKKKLHSIASKLEHSGKTLENEMNKLSSTSEIEGKKLYEVTQLLNSLMGIAVLPYEMHKEFFQEVEDELRTEDNRGLSLSDIQKKLHKEREYEVLQNLIMRLHSEGKWSSTFKRDLRSGIIDDQKIVFGFLRHIRNVTCHSGNNAISILPLTEGEVIRNIMFYDRQDDQEFAMWLTVEELEEVVLAIADFYSNTSIGFIDKTKNIREAEQRVKDILNIK